MRTKHVVPAGTLLAGAFLTIMNLVPAYAGDLIERSQPAAHLSALAGDRALAATTGEVQVFVRLDMSSVAQYCVEEVRAGRPVPSANMQRAHARAIDAQHVGIRSQLEALGATELSSLRVGDNGLRVRVDASLLDSLRSIAGVLTVAPVALHTPDLSRSVPWIEADAVHAVGITGDGITIAVIDTGIDYLHANLGGAGDPADYAANNPETIEPGSFPTAKVIGGIDFAGTSFDASGVFGPTTPSPDPDPLDVDGHGSHVSGIAAGLGVASTIGEGMAPGASLYALKVFGDIAGSTDLVSDAIEFALDPNGDGDTSDHVDVINMSLGSAFGDPRSPSAIASQNAVNLGIIVVASAGNAGDIPYVTGSPAIAPNVISVAASISGGDAPAIEVSGDISDRFEAVEGTSPVRLADGSVTGPLAQPSDPSNIEGCNPISDDMTGAIALISRGTCFFNTKFINAQTAGATGIVVYNDGANPQRIAPIVMGGVSAGTIPGVMVSFFAGDSLSSALSGSASLTALLDEALMTPTIFGDVLAGFSSGGPGHGGSTFKPDVTAPGSGIVSTGVGTGAGPATLSGTSMSSPHAAGLAALLLDKNPDWSPTHVKAAIQNSAVPGVPDGTVASLLELTRQGTGVIRADRAVNATVIAHPGGVSFGRINPTEEVDEDVSFSLHNLGGGSRTFSVTHEANQTFPGVDVECPDPIGVGSQKEEKAKIRLSFDPTVGPFDDAFHSQTEVDGWCVLSDGTDELRVGYIAVVDPASDMEADGKDGAVEIENNEGNLGWAEGFTLAAQDGLLLDDAPNAFNATGFRTNSFAAFGDLVEFGISTERTWETLAAYEIDIFVDHDSDGLDDFILVAADFFDDGMPVTAIFPQGFALFTTGADLNDAAGILTFFGRQDSPLGFLGFLPPGDTDFDYTAFFFDLRDGSFDVQFGSIDLADEIVPDFNSFGLFPDTEVEVPVSGAGDMLWLFQNNEAKKGNGKNQADIVFVGDDD